MNWEEYTNWLLKAVAPVLGEYCWEFCGSPGEDEWHDDKCIALRHVINAKPDTANPNPLGA